MVEYFLLRRSKLYILVALVGLAAASSAQQSAKTFERISGRAQPQRPANDLAPKASERPAKFMGWKSSRSPADDPQLFSRPPARVARARELMNAAKANRVPTSAGTFSSLAGVAFRDSLPAGLLPTAVVTGDFNGDGNIDFVVANGGDNTLWLYLGKGDGTFLLPTVLPITLGQSPVWVAAADLRAIGKLDLIVAEADSHTVGVFLGNGDGTFVESAISIPGGPGALAIGDFNKDGKPDVAVAMNDSSSPAYLLVLPGQGDGSFGNPIITPVYAYASGLFWASSGDLNGDGSPDLVVSSGNIDSQAIQAFISNGDGTFSAGQVIAENFANQLLGTVLVDADEDGKLDVVVTDDFGFIEVYHGNGDGTFSSTPNFFGVGDVPYAIGVADVNGDGHMDVITSGVNVQPGAPYGAVAGNLLSVLLGDGKGNFSSAEVYRGDVSAFSLAVADFNGDGHADVVTGNQDSDSAVVFLNDGKGGFGDPRGKWIGYLTGAVNAPMSGMISADVNGDGFADLVLMEWNQLPSPFYQLTVLLNDGTGQFSDPVRSDAVDSKYTYLGDFVLADFRNTGFPDFLAIGADASFSSTFPYISFAPNAGSGKFGPLSVTTPAAAQGVLGVGDFNRDGNLDFVTATAGGLGGLVSVSTFIGHGDGKFTAGPVQGFVPGGGYPVAIYVGDFNQDGNLDLLVFFEGNGGWTSYDSVFELFGNGDGSFLPAKVLFPHLGPMIVADVNHDGRPDIIEMSFPLALNDTPALSEVSIYLGEPDGSFTPTATYTPYIDPDVIPQFPYATSVAQRYAPMIGDFNGDGNFDIAVFQSSSSYPETVYVQFLLGNGDGTFAPTFERFDFGKYFIPNLAADITGTGRWDLIELDGYRASFHVLQSKPKAAFELNLVGDPVSGNTDTGLITLNLPASSPAVINLNASDPAIIVPPTVTVPAGQFAQTFPITVGAAFNPTHVFAITGQLGTDVVQAFGTQLPSAGGGFSLTVAGFPTMPEINLAAGEGSNPIQIIIASVGGYGTTVSFQCVGLPSTISCQLLPASVPISPQATGTITFVVSAAAGTPLGSYAGVIQASDGVVTQTLVLTVNVGDFSMSISPQIVQAFPTDSADFNLTMTPQFQFNQSVILSWSGLPGSVTCALCYPGSVPGGNTPFDFQTAATPPGNYTLTIAGTSGPLSHSASAQLQVWDFSPSVSPISATIKAGTSTNFNITVLPVNGFNGPVTLACTNLTSPLSCTFNPPTLAVSAISTTATLTVSAAPSNGRTATTAGGHSHLFWLVIYGISLPAGLVLLGSLQPRRKSILLLIVMLFALFTHISCGGGGGGAGTNFQGNPPPPPPPPAPKSYTIGVQVSSVNASKSAGQIVITVD